MPDATSSRTAVVIGATGLIGGFLVQELLADAAYGRVIALTRRPLELQHPKLTNRIVDFSDEAAIRAAFDHAEVIFCAIGTTQKQVQGDNAAYRKIDLDIPVSLAWIGQEKGVRNYVFVSAAGAAARTRNFYLGLKGEAEEAISGMKYTAFYALRPSLLLGPRKEHRTAERLAQSVMGALSFLFRGRLSRYHPVQAADVARAMVAADREGREGRHIWHYREIMAHSRG
jgi:uncharacterized protein YbjT (DUF2867 family)